MHELAKRLLGTIRKHELLRPGDRLAAAVSGGADSVALLCLLQELRDELGIVLSVAHVNHQLRGAESDEDERFVAQLAAGRGLDFHTVSAPVKSNRPGANHDPASGVEAAARKLRYDFFGTIVHKGNVSRIATAHTLDDQAETVLLRIFRGSGIRGLAGIRPRLHLQPKGSSQAKSLNSEENFPKNDRQTPPQVVRPLLSFRRAELRDYLRSRGQCWREDSSNENMAFFRNRVRQRLLPLIVQEFGTAAIDHLAELAEIARAEDEWRSEEFDCKGKTQSSLNVDRLLALPLAAERRMARAWLSANAPQVSISFRLIEEILDLARGDAGRKMELTGQPKTVHEISEDADAPAHSVSIRRGRTELVFESTPRRNTDYEYALTIPGKVIVPELGACIEARVTEIESVPEQERHTLLNPDHLGAKILIRNWRPGDRYCPAHTAAERKVKELLAARHATGMEKKLWPVAVAEDSALVWMRGFAAPKALGARAGKAIWIREIAAKNPAEYPTEDSKTPADDGR